MSSGVFTIDEQVQAVSHHKPHVVILGAGASRAAFSNGDRNGRRLPLIQDFVKTVGLEDVLHENGVDQPYDDFEGLYSNIASDDLKVRLKNEIERRVFDYFAELEMPDDPTLYDHLVLSLRPKDIIATFNWDPFLWQATARNYRFGKAPELLFLHGNVAIGYCAACKVVIGRHQTCTCGRTATPSPILFPVKQKNYQSDPAISAHWRTLQSALKLALTVTFFGYGAPKTDVEAVKLLRHGWGDPDSRIMEETEVIDVRAEAELEATWSPFIHSHHYCIRRSFYDSNLAKHPRRSCEAIWGRVGEARFVDVATFPESADFNALYRWLQPRIDAESSV